MRNDGREEIGSVFLYLPTQGGSSRPGQRRTRRTAASGTGRGRGRGRGRAQDSTARGAGRDDCALQARVYRAGTGARTSLACLCEGSGGVYQFFRVDVDVAALMDDRAGTTSTCTWRCTCTRRRIVCVLARVAHWKKTTRPSRPGRTGRRQQVHADYTSHSTSSSSSLRRPTRPPRCRSALLCYLRLAMYCPSAPTPAPSDRYHTP